MISGSSAGFGRRLAALLYDAILLAALLMIFTGGAVFFTHGAAVLPATAGAWVYLYRLGLVGVIAGYYLLNWLRSGQTLGMRAWHLRAVTESGKPLAFKSAALRLVLGALAWMPAALGVLWLYVDPEHLALHDRLSRTRVVHLARS
ncbi:MAG TPA: RDD family protein [Steroidobacteraceae bacterium]|nr:RDD family protein [Steroidobacteraceae bacterium]